MINHLKPMVSIELNKIIIKIIMRRLVFLHRVHERTISCIVLQDYGFHTLL